jgi:plasmid stabilization system protein ParE
MSYFVQYSPEAETDVKGIIDWYAEKSTTTVVNFLVQLKQAEERLKANPHSFRKTSKLFRRIIIKRFPYSVYFIESENIITILAIIHFARSKKYIKSRLKK